MLLWLFEHLAGFDSTFQVVRYLTLRALLSVLTALDHWSGARSRDDSQACRR